jgi:hypothetical protein
MQPDNDFWMSTSRNTLVVKLNERYLLQII